MGADDTATRLARARAAHRPGSRVPHTVVVLPSYSMGRTLVAHYGPRIVALEHRQLLCVLGLARVPGARIVFVTAQRPEEQVLDYHLSLLPAAQRADVRARIEVLEVPDPSPRSITAKLLDRPDLLASLRWATRGRLAWIEPWNVTALETEVARLLDLPLNGTPPDLWPLGFKSAGRRLMRRAGVPLPAGREDVRSVDDVVAAMLAVRRERPCAPGVVVKLDNSGTGDGNRVLHLPDTPDPARLRAAVEGLEEWYLDELADGAVVEELLVGARFTSPSVQGDISPTGRVTVLSTHEQLLSGPTGQVYSGCRFPADPAYALQLQAYGAAVGELLAGEGALGRYCVDFGAVQDSRGRWSVRGLEINLRKSGTSHPLSLLHNLVGGRYDGATGRWQAPDGTERCYRSTDNLVDPAWHGRPAEEVIGAVRAAGLELCPRSRVGVVLHMFVGLDVDGRIGLTAIGHSPEHAEQLYQAAVRALSPATAPLDVAQAG